MKSVYRMDKTLVATKNRASLDTSADTIALLFGLFGSVHTFSPNLNGKSNVLWLATLPPSFTVTFISKFHVVYRAHIANIYRKERERRRKRSFF